MNKMDRQETDHLEQAIRSLQSIQCDLTDQSRHRLARKCAESLAASRVGMWSRIQAFLAIQLPQRAMATALGLALFVGVAALLVSQKSAVRYPGTGDSSPVQLVSLRPDAAGRITLEWRDGKDRTYKVLKSNNPKDFSGAVQYSVHGNRWTDQGTGVGQVTYYRVE